MKRIRTLLLVEDNDGDARLLWEMFKEQDGPPPRLIHAKSMAEAEARLAENTIDLILLDLGLPDARGLEAVRRIRGAAPHVPIVVLTGMDDETLAAQALQEGAQDYLIKGEIEARALLRGLRYALERKNMEEAASEAMEQLHASERAARRSADAMSAFLTTMSHEIRTPLNGVLGMAQAMAMGDLPAEQRGRLTIIQTAGEALLLLLNDLLDLSKIQAGRLELEEGILDAQELADGVMAFKALVEARDLHFQLTVAPSARGAWGADPKRVRQILHNLLSNAVKFTPSGSVVVDLSHDGVNLTMQVRDTGIGIPQDRIAHVFDRFVQADASMTRSYGGSGLGLAICRDLVLLMNGEIAVESTQGVGTTFTVRLPLRRADPVAEAEADDVRQILSVGSVALRVLSAEDNPINQVVLQTLLEGVGIQLATAANGEEAVRMWGAGRWDIVLMDIQMPVMDGLSAFKQIREIERRESRSRTPVIAVTANAMAHHIAEYLDAGMDAVVAKPVSLVSLLHAMDAVLATAPCAAQDGITLTAA